MTHIDALSQAPVNIICVSIEGILLSTLIARPDPPNVKSMSLSRTGTELAANVLS